MSPHSVDRDAFFPAATARLHRAHTLLDIGPGIRPQTLGTDPVIHICAEPCVEYAERLISEHPALVVLNCTWADALELLPPASVDTVLLMDVIEHLEKAEGQRLLDATVRLARGQVVVMTPYGFMPQGDDEDTDAWGLGGTDWQVHRSGWLPEEFPGWEIVECRDFHTHDAYGRELDEPFGAFFAILDKGAGLPPEANALATSLLERAQCYEDSTVWKLTKPLRRMADLVKRRRS